MSKLDKSTHALLFEIFTDEGIKHTGVGQGGVALNTSLLEHILEELPALRSVELVGGRELLASDLLQRGNHLNSSPGSLPVNLDLVALGSVVLGLVAAVNMLDEASNELLSHVDEIKHVSVSHIELAGSKLGVVGQIHALVTELTSDFVDAVDATDNQHLEVKLRGNTQEHVHVEVVVVGDEGLGSGAAGDGVQHGGLDGDKVTVVEPATHVSVDLGTGEEDIPCSVVHHEIKVALAETLLRVLETIVVVGNLVQAGGEESNLESGD